MKSSFGFLILLNIFNSTYTLFDEIFTFCEDNGFNYISFFDKDCANITKFKTIKPYNLRFSCFTSDTEVEPSVQDFLILDVDNAVVSEVNLKNILKHKIRRTLMITSNFDHIYELIHNYTFNSNFFTYDKLSKKWNEVIVLTGSKNVIVNEVKFDEKGKIIFSSNLQGLQVPAITLPWAPYVHDIKCSKDSTGCTSKGLLIDLMKIWSSKLNITWQLFKDSQNDWGTKPKSGEHLQQGSSMCKSLTGQVLPPDPYQVLTRSLPGP